MTIAMTNDMPCLTMKTKTKNQKIECLYYKFKIVEIMMFLHFEIMIQEIGQVSSDRTPIPGMKFLSKF